MQAAYFLSCHRSLPPSQFATASAAFLIIPSACPSRPVSFPFESSTHSTHVARGRLAPRGGAAAVVRKPLSEKRVLEPNERAFVSKSSLSFFLPRSSCSLLFALIAFLLPATFSKWFHMTGSPFFLIHSTSGDEIMRAEGTGTPVSTYMDARYSRGASKRQCTHISTLPSDMSKLLPAGVLSRAKLLKEFGSCNICYGLHFIDVAVGWTDTLGRRTD